MFARVSVFRGDPGQVDRGTDYIRESVLPGFRPNEGLEGFYYLVDRRSGKSISITMWGTEEAMRATEEQADRLRAEIANAANAAIEGVETYEVGISSAHDAGPAS